MARIPEKHIFGVGERLTLAVKRSGMTLQELSQRTGVVAPHISSMMSGDSTMHEFAIARLCVALDISADWLLGVTVLDARRNEEPKARKKSPKEKIPELVRCKECVARENTKMEPFVCTRNNTLVYKTDFCSYGKRRRT